MDEMGRHVTRRSEIGGIAVRKSTSSVPGKTGRAEERSLKHHPGMFLGRRVPFLVCALLVVTLLLTAGCRLDSLPFLGVEPPKPQGTVPDVMRLTEEEAREKAEEAGFELSVEFVQKSDAEKGLIYEQNPKPNTEADKGSKVAAIVAISGTTVVPELIGKPVGDAEQMLIGALLNSSRKTTETNDETQSNIVLSQDPAPGTRVDSGKEVALVVGEYVPLPKPEPNEGHWETRNVTCSTCGGSGSITETYTEQVTTTCPTCGGSGCTGNPPEICPTCGGTGSITETVQRQRSITCLTCGGSGHTVERYWVE